MNMNMNILNKSKDDLWNSILQAAMQGKLSEQLDTDTPVEVTLEEIRKEREKQGLESGKKGKRKGKKEDIQQNSNFVEDEYPFEIPKSWKWLKLKDFANIVNGFTPKRTIKEYWDKKEIPWFTVEDIHKQGRIINDTQQYMTKKALGNSTQRLLPKNTVVLCCTSATIGQFALTKIELTTNQQWNGLVIKYPNLIYYNFLFYFVETLKDKMIKDATSTTFPFLSVDKIKEYFIPVPPIEEQIRVVNKLKELKNQIDILYTVYNRLEQSKIQLKESLLQSAMDGKLTQQNDNFGELADDTTVQQKSYFVELKDAVKIVNGDSVSNISLPLLDLNYLRRKQIVLQEEGKKINKNSLIIVMDGNASGEVFITEEKGYLGSTIKKLEINKDFDIKFIYYFIVMYQEYLNKNKKGAAIPHLNKDIFYSLNIPKYSIEKQQNIVNQIEEILPLI